MDIASLKEVLGNEKFTTLQSYVNDLTGQRDTARNESITGRKTLKDNLATAQALAAKAMEKLGIESADDLDTLPDAKGQAEALKQYDTKLKRAERERDDAKKLAEDASGKYRSSLQKAAVAEALGAHEFVARDVIEHYVSKQLTWDGDDLFFKSDDGKLIPVKDGVAGIAKTRPELLKPTGTGGAGMRQSNAGSGGNGKTMTRAEFEAMPPAQRVEAAKSGVQLT